MKRLTNNFNEKVKIFMNNQFVDTFLKELDAVLLKNLGKLDLLDKKISEIVNNSVTKNCDELVELVELKKKLNNENRRIIQLHIRLLNSSDLSSKLFYVEKKSGIVFAKDSNEDVDNYNIVSGKQFISSICNDLTVVNDKALVKGNYKFETFEFSNN